MGTNKVPQTPLRIPNELKEQLKEIAQREHWTLNQTMIEAIKLLIAEKDN